MQQVGLTRRLFASKSNWRTLSVYPETHPTCKMHQPRGLPPIRERLLGNLLADDACPFCHTPSFGCDKALVLCHNLILGLVWRGQASIAGTALRVLRTIDA